MAFKEKAAKGLLKGASPYLSYIIVKHTFIIKLFEYKDI